MKVLAPVSGYAASNNGTMIGRWVDQVESEGNTVAAVTMPAGCSVGDVHELSMSRAPGHVQLVGALPIPIVRSGVDGHVYESGPMAGQLRGGDCLAPYCCNSLEAWRPEPDTGWYANEYGFAQSPAVRTCSILDGSNMSQFGSERECLDRMIQANLGYRTGAVDYGGEAAYVDYLEQLLPIRAKIVADMEGAVGGAQNVHDLSTADEALRWHWFQQNAGKRFLVGGLFDGGIGRDGGVGLWNTGSMADLASGSVMMAVLLTFSSNAWMLRYWPWQRAGLLGGAVAVMYDQWARFGLSGWDEATPLCAVALAQMQRFVDCIHFGVGDYTVRRRVGELATDPRVDAMLVWQAGATADLAQIKLDVAALKGGGAVADPPPPPTALAWNLGGVNVGSFRAAAGDSGARLDTNAQAVSTAGVADAAPAQVYLTGWYGDGGFRATFAGVPPGRYRCLLHGEESWYGPGGRVADFAVNGVAAIGVDWFKVAGAQHRAGVVSVEVAVGADGVLAVRGDTRSGDRNVWLCGVELRPA